MISVTLLSSYLYCARKLYLQRVMKVVEPPKEAMVKGTIRHKTYEKINDIEQFIVTSFSLNVSRQDIYAKYKSEYSRTLREVILKNKNNLRNVKLPLTDAFKQIWHHFDASAKLRSDDLFNFIQSSKLSGDELWQNLVPKLKSEVSVKSDKLKLRGIIDQLEVYPDKILPIELKTGSVPNTGFWPGHKIQLASYIMLLNENFNLNIDRGFIVYLDNNKRRELILNKFIEDEVKELITKVTDLLNSKSIPALCNNENKCKACGIKDICHNLGDKAL